jgi:hypothetical protein
VFRPLEVEERRWLEALATGIPLGELCEKSCSAPSAESLADWVSSGLIAGIDWDRAEASPTG